MFDAGLFNISPAEAAGMDPQHRLLLDCAYLAFQDAGLTREVLQDKRVGVFVGISTNDAAELALKSQEEKNVYSANGTSHSVAAGRISFVFGLRGPCIAYDTACSSSLVALHGAVRALQHNECDAALVMGVNVMLTPSASISIAVAGMSSPTGRCHTFDKSADGYVRSEGCGAIVLKRMDNAESNEDVIHAVIKGVAVGQDGTSASLTAPNGRAQEELIHRALKDGGISGEDVDYLEAHGTGTSLGDPIEMKAVSSAMNGGRKDTNPLVLGGVKANIGHLEPAAGLAGLIKAILVLQKEQAPPNAELRTLNPKIREVMTNCPLHFPMELESLRKYTGKSDGEALIAGVSSFGYAGTIAHALVEQYLHHS